MENSFVQRKLYSWLRRETGSSGVRKIAPLRGAIASEIGNVRSDNQDKAIAFKGADSQGREYAVAVVADGIGGMSDGAECAALAIASFSSAICALLQSNTSSPMGPMKQAANSANEAVYRNYLGHGGSTLVAVLFSAGMPPTWVSAGDSRIYLQSGNNLKLLTTDDTIAGQLNKSGEVPAEHSKILQFIGMGKDLEPHVGDVKEVREGQLILTTDGVHFLDKNPEWFRSIVRNAPDAGAIAKRLIDVAKWCGGPDNATLACVGFPLQPSGRDAFEGGVQIWDSFGELAIQLQSLPPNNIPVRNADLDRHSSIAPHTDNNGAESELIENDGLEPLFSAAKPPENSNPKRSRKTRAKKPVDQDSPKLDIEFSKRNE
ncbi:hypothetical protein LC612_40300 [Nostoc sp. CHAB 5834]|nr:hypothetical protein [Nostoc sp. CHAB 5834]